MQATELAVVVLRWRAVGSRCVFVDALGDDGIELQLCFADGQLAADELSAGARLRVTARLEPLPTRRGPNYTGWRRRSMRASMANKGGPSRRGTRFYLEGTNRCAGRRRRHLVDPWRRPCLLGHEARRRARRRLPCLD